VRVLRGANLSHIRHKALEQLEAHGISTTLVVTLKKGLNDSEIGDIIAFALKYKCIRGVTLQPIQDAGRNDNYELREHRLVLSEVRRKIVEQSNLFSFDDVMPVPCNPDNLAMAYAMKIDGNVHPLTRYIEPQALMANSPNTISFEALLKEKLFSLLSTGEAPTGQASRLSDLLCCLPDMALPTQLTYENVFRVLIVQFMDVHSMDIRALKKSCVHFAQPDGQMIPFESYNVFYRSAAQREKLALIRQSLVPRSLHAT
jgi:7,8-dihydro-6-hydroxymethylpterin dimethyltransferase